MNAPEKPVAELAAASSRIERLAANGDFGHPTAAVEIVETHISWILLTGDFAYKIKKPVDLGFLDFSTLDARQHYCRAELDLNRRFAPDLYLDVVPIGEPDGRPTIGATPAVEYAVRMRQFPARARLDRQIDLGLITVDDMRAFGAALAQLHERTPAVNMATHLSESDRIAVPVRDNFTALREHYRHGAMRERIDALADTCDHDLQRLAATFRQRRVAGRIRECHGDLHLQNLVRIDGVITPFDGIEFDANLRCIDVMNEVAFLLMDTMLRDRADLGFSFLNRYLEVSGDYAGIPVLSFYTVYRSLVRAKIAVLQPRTAAERDAQVERHVALAERITDPSRRPLLVICRGLSGSGKTWLSERLLPIMPAIRLRSDIVRKHLHDLPELADSGSPVGAGLYDADATTATYAALAAHADDCLSAGYDTIIDATCLRRAERSHLYAAADRCGAEFAILDCSADTATLTERIAHRQASAADASEANQNVLAWQQAHAEPLSAKERRHAVPVDTRGDLPLAEIMAQLRAAAGSGP